MPRTLAPPRVETLADLLRSLGRISPQRVRIVPTPGTATVKDVIHFLQREKRKYELVEGTLVEKVMGAKESFIAMYLGLLLGNWNTAHDNVGMLLGEAGTLKLLKGLVRIPDLSFTNWDRVPDRKVPSEPIPGLVPNLAVEVLSEGNTKAEMERKLKEYFKAGVELVWYIDPEKQTVTVYTSRDDATVLTAKDTLTGGDVLPGFQVPVAQLFAGLQGPPSKPTKKKNGR
jgi:Uma2 family endonuclease